MNKFERSRRQFLRTASMASMAGLYASPFLMELNSVAAMAQGSGASDYRALVCVFLQGGNDGHGTVIATDSESYSAFTQARSGAPGLAYPMSQLLPIVPKNFAKWPYLRIESLSGWTAKPVQCRSRGGCVECRHADCASNKNPGDEQLCSTARFTLFAFRSNGGMAGDCVERGKCRTYRLGRIGGRSHREHGHEFKLHVHLHLDCGNRVVLIRSVVVSA